MRLLRHQSVAPRPPSNVEAAPEPAPDRAPRRAMMIALAAISLVVVGLACRHWVVTTPGFAVRRVVIEGAVHADADALSAATGALGVNMFRLDLDGVRDRLASNPWIRDARVRRILPHDLRVTVVERIPVGIEELGEAGTLVDGTGRALDVAPTGGLLHLPAIAGLGELPEAARPERLARAAASLEALRVATPRLFERMRSIDASADGWFIVLADSLPPICIAGPESADEVAGYAARIETVRRTFGDVEYVDARWRDRLFVMPRG